MQNTLKKRRIQNRRCSDYAMGWMIQCLNHDRGKSLSILWNVQTCSGANPASCSVGTWFIFREKSSWSMKLTIQFCLVLRLRMSRDVRLLPSGHGWDNFTPKKECITLGNCTYSNEALKSPEENKNTIIQSCT